MIKRILFSISMICLLHASWAQKTTKIADSQVLITSEKLGTKIEVTNIKPKEIVQSLKNCPSAVMMKMAKETGTLNMTVGDVPMTFKVIENKTMSAEFKTAAPEVKSYTLESGGIRGRLTSTPNGTYAYLFTNQGIVSIYPTVRGSADKHTIEYGHITNEGEEPFQCDQHGAGEPMPDLDESDLKKIVADIENGEVLRTYRFAVVCTGEFYQGNGNNMTDVMATITNSVNAYNELYGSEGAINFSLLTPVIYRNPLSDPFFPSISRTVQAGNQVPKEFNPSAFDIGHVFHKTTSGDGWSSGGVAYLASVCDDGTFVDQGTNTEVLLKAGGWSGSFSNVGVSWISLSSHEIGHMFNCPHTFNGTGSSCTDNISSSTAYEIGSGTTIMSYNNICDAGQNIGGSREQNLYFHSNSLIRMITYATIGDGNSCPTMTPTNNTPPSISADPCGHNGTFTIPKNTPFILTGEAEDAEGDQIYYSWEQYNEDGSGTPTQGFIGVQAANSNIAPLFRSYPPSTSGNVRYFPNKASVINNEAEDFDILPAVPRTLNFQFIARDKNANGGGVALEEMEVPVAATGPLRINTPNNSTVYTSGETTTITWSTTNSDDLCNNVDILMSIDGGESYNYTLASNVSYAAAQREITIPSSVPTTSTAKFMVKCVDSECIQFYNINRGFVDIQSDCEAESLLICSDDPVSFNQGDPALELELSSYPGVITTEISRSPTAASPIWKPAAIADNGSCQIGNDRNYEQVRIAVSETGQYRWFIGNWQQGGMSIYTAANFDPNNPCGSSIASSYSPGSFGNILDAQLEECTEYILVIDSRAVGTNIFIEGFLNVAGDINVLSDLDGDLGKTFIAVNQFGTIAFETPTSDFRNAPSGEHSVYGVSYKQQGPEPPVNVDPTTWVGLPLSDVFNGDNCFALSSTAKPVTIISSCNITEITAGAQTSCNSDNNEYTQELTISYLMPPTGNLIVNGQSFAQTSSPQTVTLTALADGAPTTVTASFEENPGCQLKVDALYMSPENCCNLSVDLPDNINACGDEMIVLNAGNDGATYMWERNGVDLPDTDFDVDAETAGTYRVTVTTASGCAKPDETEVNFFDIPIVSVSAEDSTGCDGEQLVIDLMTNEGDITWFKDGVEVTGQVSDELRVMEGGTYTGRATSGQGCIGEDIQIMQFSPSPDVDLGIDRQLCGGNPLTLDAGNDGMEYVWFKDGTLLVGESGNMLDVQETGMYSVSVLGQAECSTDDMITVEFFALPEATLGGDTAICAGTPVEIFPNIANVTEFSFFKDGSDITPANLNQITITEGGTYELIVSNEIGCELIQSILVVENNLPVVELDAEKVGCIGSEVILESPIIGGSYSWTFNGSEISTEATVNVSQEGNYQLVVADDFGCEGMDVIDVSFVPGPTLSIDGAQDFCAGDMTTLQASTTGDNIQWAKDGSDISGATDFSLDVTEAGTYTASVSGNSGCVVEDQVSITVFENPTVEAGGAIVLCEGDSEDRTITTTGQGIGYQWTLNGSAFTGNESINVTESGTYKIVVISSDNCLAEDEFEVRVSQLPTVIVSPTSIDICEGLGQDVNLTATDASRIEWYRNGNLIAGETGTTLNIATDGMYEAIVFNADDCSASTMVSATSRPSPSVELGSNQGLCPNETISLDAGSQTTYAWSTGSDMQSIMVGNPNLDIETSETYSVMVTNEFNCSAQDEVTITFSPIITGEISDVTGVCSGDSVMITAGGGLFYDWTDPNGTLDNTTQSTVLAKPSETTTYTVVISDSCPDNTDELSATVEVFAPAMADAGLDTIVILGRDVTLMGSGGVSYLWTDELGNIVGTEANPTVMPLVLTEYTLQVTDENGCTAESRVIIDVDQNPLAAFEAVNIITPNDDGDNDALEFIGLETEPDNTLMIYNRWGNLVFEAVGYQTTGGLWSGTKNGENLPADTYYYVLKFGDQVHKSAITILRD